MGRDVLSMTMINAPGWPGLNHSMSNSKHSLLSALMKAVIVEDQPDVREELHHLIAEHCSEITIAGSAGAVVAAARLVRESAPDLLFLDIELPDGTGFDLLDLIDQPVKVIFITGSDEYAIKAFRYAAIDYLLKPVDPADLIVAVDRARQSTGLSTDQLNVYRASLSGPDAIPEKIALHTSDKIHFIRIADIIRCMADGNYTKFFLKDHNTLLVAKTLKDYDKLLSSADFIRVHQSHLVNMGAVREYVKTDGGYLVMTDGAKIPVSTRKKSEVLERFGDIPHA
jgi:two-component system LytT family response regulator